MDKEQILKKLNNDDKLLVSRVFDLINRVNKLNTLETTDFLDVRCQNIIVKILNQIKYSNYVLFGGFEEAERKLLILYPQKLVNIFEENKYNFNNVIDVIRITLKQEESSNFTHRTYLGGLMKLGIKREKIGDIITDKDGADIMCKNITKFLDANLNSLKRFSKADIEIIPLDQLREIKPNIRNTKYNCAKYENG